MQTSVFCPSKLKKQFKDQESMSSLHYWITSPCFDTYESSSACNSHIHLPLKAYKELCSCGIGHVTANPLYAQTNASKKVIKTWSYLHKHLKAHLARRRLSEFEGNEVRMRKYINKRKGEIRAKEMAVARTEAEVTYTSINRALAP